MPVLNWIGKDKVVNHDQELPFRVLKPDKDQSIGEKSNNLLIQGDNLEALKALMPFYYQKVKFIYIDPPYNTGTEKWIYNDKVNAPQINSWLNKVVGVEGEDLCRHDKWLCMMYPRLKLLKELLSEDGVIFISIDENEEHHLKSIMDEIFGAANFIEKIVWNKRVPKNDKGIGNIHEYILLYAKDATYKHRFTMPKEGIDEVYEFVAKLKSKKIPIPEAEAELKKFYLKKNYDRGITLYCNLDENYRIWGKINISWPNSKDGPRYDILHPSTKKPTRVPANGWRYKESSFNELVDYDKIIKRFDDSYVAGKIWFGKDERTQPSVIQYLDGVKDFLLRSIISIKSSGGSDLDRMLADHGFPHPKPPELIKQLIKSVDGNDFYVLDSFAGSGTTGHSVLELNKEDGGDRKFILVELEPKIAKNVTAKRLKKVIEGYEGAKFSEGTGGGFRYLDLNGVLYDYSGYVNPDSRYEDMAAYIYFTETKSYLDISEIKKPFIGSQGSISYFLFFKEKGNNVLDEESLKKTAEFKGSKIIYADKCLIDEEKLAKKGITFKQIPYELKKY